VVIDLLSVCDSCSLKILAVYAVRDVVINWSYVSLGPSVYSAGPSSSVYLLK